MFIEIHLRCSSLKAFFVTGRCLNMESGSLIKFQVGDADELQRTPLNFIKIGFITSRKQGILLQIRKDDLQNNIFKSAALSVNNNGKVNQRETT